MQHVISIKIISETFYYFHTTSLKSGVYYTPLGMPVPTGHIERAPWPYAGLAHPLLPDIRTMITSTLCSRGTITCYDFHPQTPRESFGFHQTHSPAAGTGWWQIRWKLVRCDLQVPEQEAGRAEAAAVATQNGRAGREGPRGLLSLQLPPGLSPGASPLGQKREEGSRREREEGRCPKVPP